MEKFLQRALYPGRDMIRDHLSLEGYTVLGKEVPRVGFPNQIAQYQGHHSFFYDQCARGVCRRRAPNLFGI